MSETTTTATDTTVKPHDFQGLARNAFEASKTYFDSAVRSQIDADLRQFYGIHPAGSKYHSEAYKARSKIFRPKTRMAIRKNEAVAAEALFSTADVVSVTAVDPDDPMQVASAAINKELLQHRLTKTIPWFTTAIGAYQDAQAVGICCSYQYWRYEKKGRRQIDEPCIDLIPVENVRFDQSADWRDVVTSSPYFIHEMPMYVKDVRARMDRVDPKTNQPKWTKLDDSIIKQALMPYSNSTRQLREDKRPDSTNANRGITDFDVVSVLRIFMEVDGQDMVWYCLANSYHVLSKPVPIEDLYHHGKRPYQIGFCVIETHKTHPSGVARLTTQQQAEINEIANTRLDNVKLAMSKRWKAKRGKQVDIRSLQRNIPGSVTLVTDMEDVEEIEFTDVTSSAYQEQDRLNLDFDDMAGNFSQSSIQSNRNLNETVGGMKIMDANVGQMTGYQLRTWIETWVEPVLRQVVLLEQFYEDDQVLLALAGKSPDALAYFQQFGTDAITDELLMQELTINVNVGMSATNPQQQVERFVFGMKSLKEVLADGIIQAAGGNVTEITREVMGKLGYRDGKRFFPGAENEDPQVTALKEENARLQAELAAKRPPPELTAAQVAKLEAETSEIEQRVLMAAQNPEKDIDAEVEAQIADVTKRADAERTKSEQTIAEMRQKQASREAETAAKADVTKYTADKKADTDLKKEELKAKTAKELADMEERVEKKLKPLQKRLEVLTEQVKKARESKAAKGAKK
jgi:hypothetical protein